MEDFLHMPEALRTPFKLLTSLAIGLLLGLQRERTPSAKAGLRTFALVALLGTILGLVAEANGSTWVVTIADFQIDNLLSLIAAVSGNTQPGTKAKKLP